MLESPWPLPLAFTSQAFNKTADGAPVDQDAVYNMVQRCEAMHAQSIAVQVTEGITKTEVGQLRAEGLYVVAWCRCDNSVWEAKFNELGPFDGLMPQIESPVQCDAAVAALRSYSDWPGLELAVVTDWIGYEPDDADRVRATGAGCVFVEAYAEGGAQHADLAHYVVEFGGTRGYTPEQCVPTVGTYRNEFPSSYAGLESYGSEFAVYLLEPMTGLQLDAFGDLAEQGPGGPPSTELPAPPTDGEGDLVSDTPTGAEARTATWTAARFWKSKTSQPDPLSRATNVELISSSKCTDDKWKLANKQVAQALKDAGIQ